VELVEDGAHDITSRTSHENLWRKFFLISRKTGLSFPSRVLEFMGHLISLLSVFGKVRSRSENQFTNAKDSTIFALFWLSLNSLLQNFSRHLSNMVWQTVGRDRAPPQVSYLWQDMGSLLPGEGATTSHRPLWSPSSGLWHFPEVL
jgi:hypothetical protein